VPEVDWLQEKCGDRHPVAACRCKSHLRYTGESGRIQRGIPAALGHQGRFGFDEPVFGHEQAKYYRRLDFSLEEVDRVGDWRFGVDEYGRLEAAVGLA
jgi:hypothetical protein